MSASRYSRLICALVLALRKVAIFGPGGGAPPLVDPRNPAYDVTVSDEIAAGAREGWERCRRCKTSSSEP